MISLSYLTERWGRGCKKSSLETFCYTADKNALQYFQEWVLIYISKTIDKTVNYKLHKTEKRFADHIGQVNKGGVYSAPMLSSRPS